MTLEEEFEDGYDGAYCEGDPDPEQVDWDEVHRLQNLLDLTNSHPNVAHRDLSSVGILADMYGEDLVVM